MNGGSFALIVKLVTNSCNNSALTPMDYPLRSAYLTPNATAPTGDYPHYLGIRRDLLSVAEAIAKIMAHPSAIIDCAYIDDVPGCVELNPFRLGQFGLFACDVRALVKAVIKQHQK